jgi:hypothetical protein
MVDIFDAYSWLNKFGESHFSACSEELIQQMKIAVDENRTIDAWNILGRLKHIRHGITDDLEVAEIQIECAMVAYRIGYLDEAVQLLESTIPKYISCWHQLGIVQWMLGSIYWINPSKHDAAVLTWQRSLSAFDHLARSKAMTSKQADWYREKWEKMKADLQCAISGDCIPSTPAAATSHHPGTAAGSSSPPPSGPTLGHTSSSGSYFVTDWLEVSTVTEEIQAGRFVPVGAGAFPPDPVLVNNVEINGRIYKIISLRDRGGINLLSVLDYTVLKVQGDSMNQAGIDSGDYILLKKQNTADPNDIVAAEIVAVDTQATLKRFIRRGANIIILKPESSNLTYQERTFTRMNEGFYISGVALAVFKPV